MIVRYYQTQRGTQPVRRDYLDKLDAQKRAGVLAALAQVEAHGFDAASVEFRQLVGKLWEIKIPPEHRVLYAMADGVTMVLLHAFKKQGQKAPRGELGVALARMADLARRMGK